MAENEEAGRPLCIQHEKKMITAAVHEPVGERHGVTVILTHGAGGDMNFPPLISLARSLKDQGFSCLRFTCKGLNIVYRTKVYATVLEYIYNKRNEFGEKGVILAGRSMGSRAAVGVANQHHGTDLGDFILGVVCLAYPLHRPKVTDNLRHALLCEMKHSCLVVNGTADAMCERSLMDNKVLSSGEDTPLTVHWIEGADHGFKVKGRAQGEVCAEVAGLVVDYCKLLVSRTSNISTDMTMTKDTVLSSMKKGGTFGKYLTVTQEETGIKTVSKKGRKRKRVVTV